MFVVTAAGLGTIQLVSALLSWHSTDISAFLTYLSLAVVCSSLQIRYLAAGPAFSLNLLFILLSMVQLSRHEALAVGCAGVLAQCVWDPGIRSRWLEIGLRVSTLALAIGTADFTCHSLLPRFMRNDTVLLLFASGALFFATTFPAAIALRLGQEKRIAQIWRESYFWSFPYYLVAAAIANAMRAGDRGISLETAMLVLPVLYLAYRYYRTQKSELAEKEKRTADLASLHLRAVQALAMAVEAKDLMNTRGHLRRVQVYAAGLGKELMLSEVELQALNAAALLHDIGKLAVPEHILTKPGKLSPHEFAAMKVHPLVGAEIVEKVQFPYPVAPIVCAHHEKWDGSGYPFGLKGEEIPLAARILAAVDCLDALTSDREYRPALSLDEGMQHIVSEAGRSFDPKVVEALERRYRELDLMARDGSDQGMALSAGIIVERGEPGAGLDLTGIQTGVSRSRSIDFQDAIATAGRETKVRLQMAQNIASSRRPDETIQHIRNGLELLVPFDGLALFLRDGDLLTVRHAAGRGAEVLSSLHVPVGQGLVGWVAQNGRSVVNGNPRLDPGFVLPESQALQSCLAMPLGGSQGRLGVLALYRTCKDAFTREDLRVLVDFAPLIGGALDQALLFQEMELRANTDRVTGLPNSELMKQSLESELARATRRRESICVTLCEVSGLAELRRRSGDAAADQLLRSVAGTIRNSCRGYDTVAWVAPDRFGLILPGMSSRDLLGKTATLDDSIRQAAAQAGGAGMVQFTFSAAFYPDDGDSAKSLLAIANRRMEQKSHRTAESLHALQALTGEALPVEGAYPDSRSSGYRP